MLGEQSINRLKDRTDGLPVVVILTALQKELLAVVTHLNDRFVVKHEKGSIYECGIFTPKQGQSWAVAIVETGMGNAAATSETHFATHGIDPDLILFVGVGGGLKSDDVDIGDVVAGSKVHHSGGGKDDEEFSARPDSIPVASELVHLAKHVARNSGWLDRIPNQPLEKQPSAQAAPIVAGDAVISSKNSEAFARIRKHYNDALVIDMEGYGAMQAAHRECVKSLIIRGVSDLIEKKSETDAQGFQEIAAANASAFAFELLANFQCNPKPSTSPSTETDLRLSGLIENTKEKETENNLNDADTNNIKKLFYSASTALKTWPTSLDQGHVVARPEIREISSIIQNRSSSSILLLGEPGSGKSALLSTLASELEKNEISILAIKADTLGVEISDEEKLSRHLGIEMSISKAIKLISNNEKIVVFIDQLDALADLVDLHSQRLNVLLNLIRDISSIDNVHIVASCRKFEHQHDVRLRSIDADAIELSPLNWNDVTPILEKRAINSKSWPEKFREILLNPQHLKTFLELLNNKNEVTIYESYQSMMELLWREQITTNSNSINMIRVVNDIAQYMAEEELFWIPKARYDGSTKELDELEASGIIIQSSDKKSISFRHQTLFEFARARTFAREDGELHEYVIERQDALFVRPKLWSSLIYLRSSNIKAYWKEFTNLWGHSNLRKHIRFLMIEYVGQVPEPTHNETEWMINTLDNNHYTEKLLLSIALNKDWYTILYDSHIRTYMQGDLDLVKAVLPIISSGWKHSPKDNLSLVREHWTDNKELAHHAFMSLHNITNWDEEIIDYAIELINKHNFADREIMFVATNIAKYNAEYALQVLSASFNKMISDINQNNNTETSKTKLSKFLQSNTGWYSLQDIVKRSPKPLITYAWKSFACAIEKISYEKNTGEDSYKNTPFIFDRDDEDKRLYPLTNSFRVAIEGFAKTDPLEYVNFVKIWCSSNSRHIHNLLGTGLTIIAKNNPEIALNYLLEDDRRFTLGNYNDEHYISKILISTVSNFLTTEQLHSLIEKIKKWNFMDRDNVDANIRQVDSRYNRQHRLYLLDSIEKSKRTNSLEKFIDEEKRAFPHHKARGSISTTGANIIGSPMSSEQMMKAKDDEILHLFDDLTDQTEWDNPKDWMRGGSVQASREFAAFSKKSPERANSLIRQMQVGLQERPAGYAISALAEAKTNPEELYALIEYLTNKGFSSEPFIIETSNALHKLSFETDGLPDKLCTVLENWLSVIPLNTQEDDDGNGNSDDEEDDQSILWKSGSMGILPQGSYNILRALETGYLLKKPMKPDNWLEQLSLHLNRNDNLNLWKAIAPNLRYLKNCNHIRAEEFLSQLFEKYPQLLACAEGAILLTYLRWWVSKGFYKKHLYILRNSQLWKKGAQVFGEIALLTGHSDANSKWLLKDINEALSSEGHDEVQSKICVGILHSALHMWDDPDKRSDMTSIIERIIPVLPEKNYHILFSLFWISKSLRADKYTLRVLDAFNSHPAIFNYVISYNSDVLGKIKNLLPSYPEHVYTFTNHLVTALITKIKKNEMDTYIDGPDIIDIALTLQRYEGESRLNGLTLFESLLDYDVYGARKALIDIDNRPVTVN